jgi:hypothetical protein
VSGRVLADSAIQTYASVRQLTNTSGNAYPAGATPTAYSINYGDPESASELFAMDYSEDRGFRAVSLLLTLNADGTGTTWPKSYTSGEVDVRNVHTLYVHSNALSNFTSIGPKGSRSVLARIPVLGLSGSVENKQHSRNLYDIIDCSGKMLRLLGFSVRNSHNQIVDLHGGSLSMEIICAPMQN